MDAELAAVGRAVPQGVYLGCCSWTFEGWKGRVYRRSYSSKRDFVSDSLEEYSHYPLFRTVEIDSTYYAPPRAERLADYADMLPDGYPCAIKVWQDITTMVFPQHPRYGDRAGLANPGFLDAAAFEEFVIEPIREGLAEHTGPVLICVPPARQSADPAVFEKQLARFLASIPAGFNYAVEIRDRSLFTRRYVATLRDFGAAHVINYWSRMPSIAEQLELLGGHLGPFAVCRLMLPPNTRYEAQKEAYAPFDRIVREQAGMRREVVDLCRQALESAVPIYVYANNKAEGSAPLTIEAIARELGEGA